MHWSLARYSARCHSFTCHSGRTSSPLWSDLSFRYTQALVGNNRDEHVFALTQSLELYDVYQAKILDCDRKLEVRIAALSNKAAKPVGRLSKPRIKTKQVNTPTFDVRAALYGVLGVDL